MKFSSQVGQLMACHKSGQMGRVCANILVQLVGPDAFGSSRHFRRGHPVLHKLNMI